MSEIIQNIPELMGAISKSVTNFVKFILELPEFFYSIINVIPEPLNGIVLAFIPFILFVIFISVIK